MNEQTEEADRTASAMREDVDASERRGDPVIG